MVEKDYNEILEMLDLIKETVKEQYQLLPNKSVPEGYPLVSESNDKWQSTREYNEQTADITIGALIKVVNDSYLRYYHIDFIGSVPNRNSNNNASMIINETNNMLSMVHALRPTFQRLPLGSDANIQDVTTELRYIYLILTI